MRMSRMSDAHQILPRKSRNFSANGTPSESHHLRGHSDYTSRENVKSAPKRLFSNRESTALVDDQDVKNDNTEVRIHSEKRYRNDEWPLKNTVDSATHSPSRSPLRNRTYTRNSPPSSSRNITQQRPSKFVEGSMNDRASRQPPTSYVEDESERERWESAQHGINNPKNKRSMATPVSDTARHSTIFRFGKSLAATFNPSNWKIWSKPQDDEDDRVKELTIRQERAEKLYKELKSTGQIRATYQPTLIQAVEKKPDSNIKHDSGIDFDHRASQEFLATIVASKPSKASAQEKRYGRIYLETPRLEAHNTSPGSDAPSTQSKSNPHLNKTPLSNLHMTFSNATQNSVGSGAEDGRHSLRHIPSRKELEKQQKLVKRVSNLESKLEAARRQLAETFAEIPSQHVWSGRQRYKPGTLASLPSERLLSGFTEREAPLDTLESDSDIGMAVTTMNESVALTAKNNGIPVQSSVVSSPSKTSVVSNSTKPLPRLPVLDYDEETTTKAKEIDENPSIRTNPVADIEAGPNTNANTPQAKDRDSPAQQGSKKRKSFGTGHADDGGKYRPSKSDEDDESDDEIPNSSKKSTPQKTTARSRKSQKINQVKKPQFKNTKPVRAFVLTPATSSSIGDSNSPAATERKAESAKPSKSTKTSQPLRLVLVNKPSSIALTNKSRRKPCKDRQSNSPPPLVTSAAFSSNILQDNSQLSFSPIPSSSVPPMPPIPKKVRLEMMDVQAALKKGQKVSNAPSQGSEIGHKGKMGRSVGHMPSRQSFEWPADVF